MSAETRPEQTGESAEQPQHVEVPLDFFNQQFDPATASKEEMDDFLADLDPSGDESDSGEGGDTSEEGSTSDQPQE